MPRGGARPNSGPKKRERTPEAVDKGMAAKVLALPEDADRASLPPEIKAWHEIVWRRDANGNLTSFAAENRQYLTDKRDGKPVSNVNHIHREPLQVVANVTISEVIRKVRERKQAYERSRS